MSPLEQRSKPGSKKKQERKVKPASRSSLHVSARAATQGVSAATATKKPRCSANGDKAHLTPKSCEQELEEAKSSS